MQEEAKMKRDNRSSLFSRRPSGSNDESSELNDDDLLPIEK